MLTIEKAAEKIGMKQKELERLMAKPESERPVNLYWADEENRLLCEHGIAEYIKRSEPRQGQAPIVDDDALAVIFHECRKTRYPVRNQALLALSNYAGLRNVEISRLLIGDVWDGEKLKKHTTLYKSRTKTKQARTMYFDNDRLVKYLKPWLDYRLAEGAQADDPLFIGEKSLKAYTRHRLAAVFKAIYTQCGHPEMSSHSGRARVATRISKTAGLKAAQMMLGHTSPATTMRYERYTDEELGAIQRGLK